MEKLKVVYEIFIEGMKDLRKWYWYKYDDVMPILIVNALVGMLLITYNLPWLMVFLTLGSSFFVFCFSFRELPMTLFLFIINILVIFIMAVAYSNAVYEADHIINKKEIIVKKPEAVMTKDRYFLVSNGNGYEINESDYAVYKVEGCNQVSFVETIMDNKEHSLVLTEVIKEYKCMDKE